MTDKLTDQDFWDSVSTVRLDHDRARRPNRLRQALRPIFADHNWNMIMRVCGKYLPTHRGLDLLEVGCAPGHNLMRLCNTLGFQPHGLEYAPAGVEETQRVFSENGIDTNQVYHGDLFAEETAKKLGDRFDVVMSFGLIEHFTDPTVAIERHIGLLKPGGYLVVQIPNITGLNLLSMRILRREFIAQHNLEIMRMKRFRTLFDPSMVESVFCGRVGFFQFYGRFTRRERSFRGFLAKTADQLQRFLNPLQHLAFCGTNVTWPFSPSLMYIGRRRAQL